jgi:hypothetical protein
MINYDPELRTFWVGIHKCIGTSFPLKNKDFKWIQVKMYLPSKLLECLTKLNDEEYYYYNTTNENAILEKIIPKYSCIVSTFFNLIWDKVNSNIPIRDKKRLREIHSGCSKTHCILKKL